MKQDLIITTQNSKTLLDKAKSLVNITNKILEKNKNELVDDSWIDRLWRWADENDISDDELPRDKEKLLNMKILSLEFLECVKLPDEIGNLVQIENLYLHDFCTLPKTISNLTNLKSLVLLWYFCEDNDNNKHYIQEWISKLRTNGCDIFIDCDIH